MTPPAADLPVTASIDVGLVALALLIAVVAAAVGSVVYAARTERAREATRCAADDAPPWPFHDRTWDEVYTADAEGEVMS